jgi:hypothetical protein
MSMGGAGLEPATTTVSAVEHVPRTSHMTEALAAMYASYSDSPTAARASALVWYSRTSMIFWSRRWKTKV